MQQIQTTRLCKNLNKTDSRQNLQQIRANHRRRGQKEPSPLASIRLQRLLNQLRPVPAPWGYTERELETARSQNTPTLQLIGQAL